MKILLPDSLSPSSGGDVEVSKLSSSGSPAGVYRKEDLFLHDMCTIRSLRILTPF